MDSAIKLHERAKAFIASLTDRKITIDRCRHPSIEFCALWVFEGGVQIAALDNSADRWLVQKLFKGQPYAQKAFDTMPEALEFAISK